MTTYLAGLAIALSLLTIVTAGPVHATAEHTYGKREYAIVRGGRAPSGRLSIAVHGEGEGGYKNFHAFLMLEPAHTKTALLDGIGPDDVLDTAPEAVRAVWSPNSRHVAVFQRSSRHVVEMRLYAIEDHDARPIVGPSLYRAVAKSDKVADDRDLRSRVSELTWLGPERFVLKETRLFHSSAPHLADSLGTFGKLTPDPDTTSTDDHTKRANLYFIDFSAEAICELAPGNTYRVIELKPGAFQKR
jgi:hypothetical protein